MSRVYIGRLSPDARERDVERFFRGFGRIRDINLKNGFGFVVTVASNTMMSLFLVSNLVTCVIVFVRNLMTLATLMMQCTN